GYTSCVFFCICDIFCFSIFSSLIVLFCVSFFFFFFFNDTATSEIYTLSLHDALPIYPSFADGYALMASIKTFAGQPAATIPLMRTAMRLNPRSGYLYFLVLGRAYFFLGDHEQARINLEEALKRNPEYLETHVYMAALK